MLIRKVEDLQFRVEEACITKGDLEVNVHSSSSIYASLIFYENMAGLCDKELDFLF